MSEQPRTLGDMLARIERRAPQTRIELGLDRVRRVLRRLAPDLSGTRVISVAGTNGKGSTVAFLESIAAHAGRRVLASTSPHLVRFAERFRLDGQPLPDSDILQSLLRVDAARGDEALTWFEHVTLAAFDLASRHRPDWLVTEVGMGGRLDAVNVVDADVAVITSIGLDHQRWLGPTRRAIAIEKCGIARSGRPAVVGEKRPPDGMYAELARIGARDVRPGRDFDWRWRGDRVTLDLGGQRLEGLRPGLAGRHQAANAGCAAMAALALEDKADPTAIMAGIAAGIEDARLAGRFQRVAREPDVVIDVAHNPAAARTLAAQLDRLAGRKLAVFGALEDKNVAGIRRALGARFDRWYAATLDVPRGLDAATLIERMGRPDGGRRPEALESVADALAAARAESRPEDTIVVFGSFMTAAAAFEALDCHEPD